jgi:hypothetical protein
MAAMNARNYTFTHKDLHSAPMGYNVTLNFVTSDISFFWDVMSYDWAICA